MEILPCFPLGKQEKIEIMKLSSSFVLVCLVLCAVQSKCVSLAGACRNTKQQTMQFNINMFGKPKYEDRVTSSFNENQCERRRFSFLYHNILSCKETSTKRVYNCTSTTKSVWIKTFDLTDYTVKQYLEHCNKKLNEKYIELSYGTLVTGDGISKIHCKINGVDPFAEERAAVGAEETRVIAVDKDNFPQYPEYFPEKDSCIWNYEVEGIWSGLVITIVTAIVVILVLGVAIFIYAQKHRSEKRETLNRTVNVNLIDEYV